MANINTEGVQSDAPITLKKVDRKERAERHLKWYERQMGAGILIGVQCGWMLGIATALPLFYLAKWLVNVWMAMGS